MTEINGNKFIFWVSCLAPNMPNGDSPSLHTPIVGPNLVKWPDPVQSCAILIIVYNGVQCDMFHLYITLESTLDLLIISIANAVSISY